MARTLLITTHSAAPALIIYIGAQNNNDRPATQEYGRMAEEHKEVLQKY